MADFKPATGETQRTEPVAHPTDAAGPPPQTDGKDAKPAPPPKPKAAPPPKRTAPRAGTRAATTKLIEDALSEILTLPSAPCALLGDTWAAEHFATSGARFAHEIAKASERNDVLRKWCERAVEGETMGVLIVTGLMYLYPPLVHWRIVPGPADALGIPVVGGENGSEPTPPGFPHAGVPGTPDGTPHPRPDTR